MAYSDTDTADEGEFKDALEDIEENSDMDSDFEKLKSDIENGLLLDKEAEQETSEETQTSDENSAVPDWVHQQCSRPTSESSQKKDDDPNPTLSERLNAAKLDGEMSNEETDSEDETPGEDKSPEELKEEEDVIIQREASLTKEQLEALRDEAQEFKTSGNAQFKEGEYLPSVSSYSNALRVCPRAYPKDRSIMYANRAAARLHLDENKLAISDCSAALELNPNYLKALIRRAELYEKTDSLDEALADYQKALEMDPSLSHARLACIRLPDQIKERNEKMKDEMLGKLKDLGNMCLKPFGLSTNNFALNQDPNTGSYSINFQQNASNPPS